MGSSARGDLCVMNRMLKMEQKEAKTDGEDRYPGRMEATGDARSVHG